MSARSRPTLEARLREALRDAGSPFADAAAAMLPDTGLAHDHVRLVDTGVIARIPKQSQMDLAAAANLAYQAACFERASPSGRAPGLIGVLPPSAWLPRGALLVEDIEGRPPVLPDDLPAIAEALARVHALPLPPAEARAPLLDAADPLADLLAEVGRQARYVPAAGVAAEVAGAIDAELAAFRRAVQRPRRPPRALISFDAHPGNFVVRPDGRAVLVDLEKARYSYPPLDLAHATLYTSTTWDVATSAALTVDEVAGFCGAWAESLGATAAPLVAWIVELRRAMWLWSVSWCAKWRVLSRRPVSVAAGGEDWSEERSERDLIGHVRDRVDCYLSPPIVAAVRSELSALARRIDARS